MEVTQSSHTLALIFTIAVVASIVIQAAVFVGLFVVVRTALAKITAIAQDVTGKASPIIAEVRTIVQDVSPKVKTISSHIVDITGTVRDQTQHVNSTVDDVVDKTRAQAAKVDDMVSAVLGSISHAGSTVQAGVARPVRKAGVWFDGFKTTVETLFKSTARAGTDASAANGRSTVEQVAAEEQFRATHAAAPGREVGS